MKGELGGGGGGWSTHGCTFEEDDPPLMHLLRGGGGRMLCEATGPSHTYFALFADHGAPDTFLGTKELYRK